MSNYYFDELKLLYRVLDAAVQEAQERCLALPVSEMSRRLFAAADLGERDPEKLKKAILEGAYGIVRPYFGSRRSTPASSPLSSPSCPPET